MKEVYPGIFLIREQGKFGVIKPSENIYVIAGSDGLIYDAGYGKKKDLKGFLKKYNKLKNYHLIHELPFNITKILPSHAHPDHFSGLKALRNELGVKIVVTKTMAKIIKSKKSYKRYYEADYIKDYLLNKIPLKTKIRQKFYNWMYPKIYGLTFIDDPDIIFEDNSEILINNENWKTFSSPGHSSDHISLYNEEKGILFSGDNILRTIITWMGPPDSNVGDYIKSLEFIQNLPNLKLILSAHGSTIKDPKKRIAEILNHRQKRTNQVLDLVNSNTTAGISVEGIVKALYPKAKTFFHSIASGWVCLTLKMLEEQGMIRRDNAKNINLFYPN